MFSVTPGLEIESVINPYACAHENSGAFGTGNITLCIFCYGFFLFAKMSYFSCRNV